MTLTVEVFWWCVGLGFFQHERNKPRFSYLFKKREENTRKKCVINTDLN